MADTIDRVLIVGDSILGSTTKEILVKTCLQNSVKIQFFDSADTHVEEIIHFRYSYDFRDTCQSYDNSVVTTHNADIDKQLASALIQDFEFLHERKMESSLFHDNFHINHLLWKELQTCLINWNIDSIVFLYFPQNLQEAILYQIATVLNKQTIVFDHTVFANRYFSCQSIVDFGNSSMKISAENQTLTSRMNELSIESRSSEFAACPGASINGILQIYRFLLKTMSLRALHPLFVAKLAKHIHDAPSDISYWRDPFSKFFGCKRHEYLEFLAHNNNEAVDPNQRYIFFPLQSQKELISEIMTNLYSDQLLAIEHLARITPSDFKIYVKGSSTDCLDAVTPMFFHRIKRISKVIYLPSCINVNDLIFGSEFVATINSSLGWNALHQGKIVLTFGRPWYRNLPGTIAYKDDLSFDEISTIKLNQDNLETQIDLLYSKAHIGNLKQPSNGEHTNIPPDKNGAHIANSILGLMRGEIEFTFPRAATPGQV